jgi:hypothetical protein
MIFLQEENRKMKIGIHQHVFTSKIDKDNIDILNFIKEIGYDSVDVNVRNAELHFAKTIISSWWR